MRHYLLLLFIGFSLCFVSCREDFEFEQSTGSLEFSRDTVYLDTVFTNIGSSTYTLKVYNRSNKDIMIPSIRLQNGEESDYRLMVDGIPGKNFSNVELMAKDSMFIFIETTIDYSEYVNNETTFLYNDKILFDTGAKEQKVDLVTLVQDAIFIKPNRSLPDNIKETLVLSGEQTNIQGHELATPEELNWTNEKPYVVYGYALVPNDRTLNVAAGARVHFHANSGLIVDDRGTLKINGAQSATEALENEVIFEGDRLEPEYADASGQWGRILLLSGQDNTINHLTLKNAIYGLYIQRVNENTTPKLTITNSQIYNCSFFGLLSIHSSVNGQNIVANNCGQASVALTQGGTYNFNNCTFANYTGGFNQIPLIINDYLETEDTIFLSSLTAVFDNCIIYGSGNVSMSLENRGATQPDVTYSTTFNNCLVKLIDFSNQFKNNPLYPSTGNNPALAAYNNCIVATSSTTNRPEFFNPQRNNLVIKPESVAVGKANTATMVPNDILGFPRAAKPDLGAYVNQEFTEE